MILDEIIENKKQEIEKLNLKTLQKLIADADETRPIEFSDIGMSLIAEIKKFSPSVKYFRPDYDIKLLASLYEDGGASVISVLTDQKYFGGDMANLKIIRETVELPLLRKDFIISHEQILESRLNGADMVLLIASILSKQQISEYLDICQGLKMKALVEVHDYVELEKVLDTKADIIGINNRDLKTFQVDLLTTVELMDDYPELRSKNVVSESGISMREQVEMLRDKEVNAILVGEALLKSDDIKAKIAELTLK
jgi:indole-3-glycerol phosphate synthase